MRTLPLAVRVYLVAIWILAAGLVGVALLRYPVPLSQAPLMILWLLLYILADYFEVEFDVGDGKTISMTVVAAPLIFLVAISGPLGVIVVVLGSLIVDALGRRTWYKVLFNTAERSIVYLAMLLVYSLLNTPNAPPFSGLHGPIALIATGAIHYILNTIFVATVVALANQLPLLQVYRESFRQVHWIHFITLPLGAVLAALWRIDPWLLIPGITPLVMAQRSFKAVAGWQAESRRNKALAQEAQQLAARLERLQDAATAMIASLEPEPLLDTVSARLAALLDAAASWVVLLDQPPRLVAAHDIPDGFVWHADAYQEELQQPGVRQFDGEAMSRLHPQAPWPALVLIPLSVENRVLGAIGLALREPIALAEHDRRVLLAFGAQAALAMERVRLFDELRHKQDELVRSSKLAALGTFAAGIAHEFNNLLAGILGYAQLGLASDDVQEKDEALDVAVRACLRGRSITSGLLTFARRREAQPTLHQVRDAIEETLALVERELAKLNIRVLRDFAPVPPTICDLGQISQVVLNLLTNARDALTEQGGGQITVRLRQRGQQIELAISDNGSGIPDALQDQVFQPFMTTKGALGGSRTPGTGLGLAICHGIVESHGGTISLTSAVGRGTTVTVRLPIVGTESAPGRPAADQPVGRMKILVVDDDPVVGGALVRLLASQGHVVALAPDGESGLDRYAEEGYDLVISDVVMPGMGGAAFVERLRSLDRTAQVVVVTGQAVPEQVDQMLRAGALGVVGKPFVMEELQAAIAQASRQRVLYHA